MLLPYLLLYALIALITYLFFIIRRQFNYWKSLGIACEEPSILLGNLHGVQTKRSFADIWLDYYKKFKGTGPFAGFYWFQQRAVFILDKELVKNILIRDFNKFTDRGFYSNIKDDPLTGTLFLLDGAKWRNLRIKLSPTFTSGKMKTMFPMVIKVGEELIDVIGDKSTEGDGVLEMKEILANYTIDVIGTCAFGIHCNSLRDPLGEFRKMGRRVFVDERHGFLINIIINGYPNIARKLRLKSTPEHIEKFYLGLVRDTVAQREASGVRRGDFMDMLIDLKNNKMLKTDDGEDLTNLSIEEIAAQAFVFLVAGFETSSTTMGFALYELACHEDIQQRVREEVIAILEEHKQQFTYECIKEMQYLEQVISETLRLYTVLPVLNRYCLEDYPVPGNPKFVIKKGMPVLIPANAIHRDPDYYPNPNEFNPENFAPDVVKQRDSVEWLPFGDGPRNCIGMRFGLMQTRIGLAMLLKHFKFSVCDKTQIPLKYDKKVFLVNSEGGIYLKVSKI